MGVGDFWVAGLEFLTSVREFIAGSHDFLGAESSESISSFAKSCGIALLAESVRLQIFKEEAEASHDRIHLATDPILAVDFRAETLLGANDAVSFLILLLSEARNHEKTRSGERHTE